jgi:hypothetical protein
MMIKPGYFPRLFFILAAFAFLLATFSVRLGGHDLVPPGLLFLAIGLILP